MPEARVIGMRVRDHGTLDWLPWIDIEVAWRAVQALRARDNEIRDIGSGIQWQF
jgi:hypothetical protein